MQIDLFITDDGFKYFFNKFVTANSLLVLYVKNGGKCLFVTEITDDILKEDLMIGIGTPKDISMNKEIDLKLINSMNFVYINKQKCSTDGVCEITNSTITWNTTYKDAKAIGALLKR